VKLRTFAGVAGVALVALVTGAAGGSAACNVVPPSFAGDGSGSVSGYAVTNVRWDPAPGDPARLAAVRFELDAAATHVASSPDGGASWFPCSPAGTEWVCPLGGFPVALAGALRIVAVE